MAKKEEIDPDTLALIEWCTEVEGFLVAAGASLREAQAYIEEQAEWFTGGCKLSWIFVKKL
jgi:hypothetical protein